MVLSEVTDLVVAEEEVIVLEVIIVVDLMVGIEED